MKRSNAKSLRVLKFGGTSLGDAERIRQACLRAAASARKQPSIVVVSAMAGVTNLLLHAARQAAAGDSSACRRALAELRARHLQAARALVPGPDQRRFAGRLEEVLAEYSQACRRFLFARRATPRGLDQVAGLGEFISAELFAAALRASGRAAEAIDAAGLIVTDARYGDAAVLLAPTRARLRKRLLPLLAAGTLPVVTGFRGSTRAGVSTTLGRGSSDYTATLIAALLDAAEVTIWTDVDGVMTADPKLAPAARVIPRISFAEAVELTFFGGKVIHWKALLPVMKAGIPLRVRNSFRPAAHGSVILPAAPRRSAVVAVSALVPVQLVTVRGDGSVGPVDLTRRVLGWLDAHHTHPLLFLQSSTENAVALALGREDAGAAARLGRSFPGRANPHGMARVLTQEVGLVAAIGGEIRHAPAIVSRVYAALARRRIEIFASATGPSGQAVAVAVPPAATALAVRALHQEFRLDSDRPASRVSAAA